MYLIVSNFLRYLMGLLSRVSQHYKDSDWSAQFQIERIQAVRNYWNLNDYCKKEKPEKFIETVSIETIESLFMRKLKQLEDRKISFKEFKDYFTNILKSVLPEDIKKREIRRFRRLVNREKKRYIRSCYWLWSFYEKSI